MPVFDLIGAIGLTASAALMTAVLATGGPSTAARRAGIGIVLAAWFGVILFCGAVGAFDNRQGLGTPGIGMAALLPVVALSYAGLRLPAAREVLVATPLVALVGVNAVRVLGLFFVLLWTGGRLPAPFAPIAGWGDIAVGLTALPIAWAILEEVRGWRALTLLWNSLGLLDLCVAIGLGVTSAEGSPIRLFFAAPGTALMTNLPWVLIPAFLVPLLMLVHLAVYYRLLAPPRPAYAVQFGA